MAALTAVMLIVLSSPVLSAPMGPAFDREPHKWSVGVDGGYDRRNTRSKTNLFDQRRYESNFGLVRASYGLLPRIQVFTWLGLANLDIEDRPDPFSSKQSFFEGENTFAIGLGVSAMMMDRDTWSIAGTGYGFNHQRHDGPWPGVGSANDIDFQEWGVGLQIQRRWRRFLPYAGLRYTDVKIKYNQIAGNFGRVADEAETNLGGYGGVGVAIGRRWRAYLEIAATDEYSYAGGVTYLFRVPNPIDDREDSGSVAAVE